MDFGCSQKVAWLLTEVIDALPKRNGFYADRQLPAAQGWHRNTKQWDWETQQHMKLAQGTALLVGQCLRAGFQGLTHF